jgi:hypothetical protein
MLLGLSGSASARYQYIYGAGAFSCTDFLGAMNSGRPDVELAYTAWFAGYQTAISESSSVGFMDEDDAKKWLKGYCRNHGGAKFADAAKAWTRYRVDSSGK